MSLLVNWLESLHVDVKISNKCSRKRNLHSTCTICVEECNFEAIIIHQQRIEIHSERCTSCGDCMISCPLSAIEGIPASRKLDKGRLMYNEDYTPSLKELLIYRKRGLHSIAIAEKSLNQRWESVLNEANCKLKILGEQPIVVIQIDKEATFSRRAFFNSFQKEGKNVAKSLAPARWKMEADEWILKNYFPDYQFYKVKIDYNKCTLCHACFSFCSQKVFRLFDTFVQINHEKCVNCMDCQDICPEHAIQIIADLQEKSKLLENFRKKECRDCGQSFHTFNQEREKCHVCTGRDPEWLSPYL